MKNKKKKLYTPKEEFRRRLLLLRFQIDIVLNEPLTSPESSLPSFMHLVLDYMWCKRQSDLYKVFYPNKHRELENYLRDQGLIPVPQDAVLLSTKVDDIPF